MPIRIESKGNWNNSEAWLKKLRDGELFSALSKFGETGVAALSSATPTDSGTTAGSWYYEIEQKKGYFAIRWYNSNINDGQQIAILLQYGHGTGTGGYVQGRDYINPAIQPVFDQIEAEVRKVVSS